MLSSSDSSFNRPRLSSNQLGEYVFATPAKRIQILHDAKFGNLHRAPYYQRALTGVIRSFHDGAYDTRLLVEATSLLRNCVPANRNQAHRFQNNAEMLRRFAEIAPIATPPPGEHTIIWHNAMIEIDEVAVSVRPEIITHCPDTKTFSFTKLRFSKSKVSEDASEIILLLLLRLGRHQASGNAAFDTEKTRLIDCYARNVISGHQLPRLREQQLQRALREIRRLWQSITPDEASGGSDHGRHLN